MVNSRFLGRIILVMILLVVVIGSATFVFHAIEGWNWVQSLYFATATITTVGYGDLVPTTDASRLVVSLYVILSIPLLFLSIGIIAEAIFTRYHESIKRSERRITSKKKKKKK